MILFDITFFCWFGFVVEGLRLGFSVWKSLCRPGRLQTIDIHLCFLSAETKAVNPYTWPWAMFFFNEQILPDIVVHSYDPRAGEETAGESLQRELQFS